MSKLQRIEHSFLFLSLLFLPTQLGRHFWPEFSFVYSLSVDYLSPTVYFWDVLTLGLLGVFLLQRKKVNGLALNLLLLFIFFQSLSLFIGNVGVGLVRLEQYMITGLFGVYIASQDFKSLFSRIFWPLSSAVIFESFLGVAQFIMAGSVGFWIFGERTFSLSTPAIAKFDFQGAQFLRAYGTFSHPNILAGFLLISLLLLLSPKILSVAHAPSRMTLIMVLSSITILLTASRVALLAAFVVAVLSLKSKGVVMLLLLVLLISPFLVTRFASLLDFDSISLHRRIELNTIAFQGFLSSPIVGVGLNNFIPYTAAHNILIGQSRFLQPVHNIFLLVLVETGVLGMLGWLGIFGVVIVKARRTPLLLVWGVIGFLGLFDHYFLTSPQGLRLLFFLWGFTISGCRFYSKFPSRPFGS